MCIFSFSALYSVSVIGVLTCLLVGVFAYPSEIMFMLMFVYDLRVLACFLYVFDCAVLYCVVLNCNAQTKREGRKCVKLARCSDWLDWIRSDDWWECPNRLSDHRMLRICFDCCAFCVCNEWIAFVGFQWQRWIEAEAEARAARE